VERKQILIAIGMASAVIVALVAVTIALRQPMPAQPVAPIDAVLLAIHWLAVPGFCLLAGIGATANRRFFVSEAIDGDALPGSRAFEINQRYNRNTLEQTMLAAIAWLGLALAVPDRAGALIPVLACLFGLGRGAFWIGYLVAPWARALGFGLTFYPTAVVIVWLALRLA
jgi:hypothetical protein